jgi:hypothetical protein
MMDKKTGKKSFKGAMRIGMVMLAVVGTSAVWGQSRVIRKEVPIKSGNKATDAAPVGKPTQQATPKPACPAAIYQKACDSYLELLNAKDADASALARNEPVAYG